MKALNILLAIVVVVLAIWFAHTRDVKARQESAHRSAVTSFQKTFPIGTTRDNVEQYLESHSMKYSSTWESGQRSWSDVVQMGKEPATSAKCGTQSLLVSLEFESSGDKPQPTDKLKRVYVDNAVGC